MSLSWYYPVPGAVYGRPNPATDSDPYRRAALQEATAEANRRLIEAQAAYVPPGLGYGPPAAQWAVQPGGPANAPIVGWTVQNAAHRASATPWRPWSAAGMGTIPDWTGDPNPAAAGPYDMTQVVAYGDYNPLNRGPIGTPFWDAPGADLPDNPNTREDVGGTIGQSLEW